MSRLLLDTHTLLWAMSGSKRLSATATEALLHGENHVSIATFWELGIKISLGKLELAPQWRQRTTRYMESYGIHLLPIEPHHCEHLSTLPFHHRDPFDRMLVAQTQIEGLSMVSADQHMAAYGIEIIW
ncbi:type II toxin-antitoxin system VapC family toxin [Endothiovibrio diazotrophicus]